MKKLVIILTATLLFTLFIPEAHADGIVKKESKTKTSISFIDWMIQEKKAEEDRIKKEENFILQKMQTEKINNRIADLNTYVGKTWYVFSGSSPKGWDCSGLVLWFYSDLNIELMHSATQQMLSGNIVEDPIPGDIVSFTGSSGKSAYHNGIYIGNGEIIHSPRPGKRTEIRQITEFENDQKVVYTRIIESGKID
jgi:cell wall-associated NlpC family hydrolase